LNYINIAAKEPDDTALVGMNKGIIMERLDPWHRDFEMTFKTTVPTFNQEKLYAMAFVQWVMDQRDTNLPFFVWAEGHYMCTEAADDNGFTNTDGHTINFSDLESTKGSVQYHNSDSTLVAGIDMIWAEANKLYAYHFKENKGFIYEEYDTTSTSETIVGNIVDKNYGKPGDVKYTPYAKNAYVWTKGKQVFAAPHEFGKIHHSSFVSGDMVRCAGMIGVKKGNVVWVDNDSGHYHPNTRHLKNFVEFLSRHNVLDNDARVYDEGTKQPAKPWRQFLNRGPVTPQPSVKTNPPGPISTAQSGAAGFKCGTCGWKYPNRVTLCWHCSVKGPIIPA
jgi:oxalate decarboxylase/phosphoglucose isomerase-like protein (cupin superfamily)